MLTIILPSPITISSGSKGLKGQTYRQTDRQARRRRWWRRWVNQNRKDKLTDKQMEGIINLCDRLRTTEHIAPSPPTPTNIFPTRVVDMLRREERESLSLLSRSFINLILSYDNSLALSLLLLRPPTPFKKVIHRNKIISMLVTLSQHNKTNQ